MIEEDSLYVENIMGTTINSPCSVQIVCAHAMAVLRSKHDDEYGMNIYEYSSPLYKVETYILAYSESINVVPIES
ncbi:hypothetical protein KY284_010995 [Solanum tuberosum]|nr:hypothetical protein KY284_010995 [Solanum tuberosum]